MSETSKFKQKIYGIKKVPIIFCTNFSPDILQFCQHLATFEMHAKAQVCSPYL